jgi:hypothetical protein
VDTVLSRSPADDDQVTTIQPVVVAFARYLHDQANVCTTEPCSRDAARRFWAALAPMAEAVETVRVAAALEALADQAPHHVYPITD